MPPTMSMSFVRRPVAVVGLALIACAGQPAADRAVRDAVVAGDTATIAFWNVENLFDCVDDPANPGDDEYLPANGWTAALYAQKLGRLAEVVGAVRPHVLGLAEIENRRVLEDLVRQPALVDLDYRIAHRDSPDKRGIDTALLFRAPFALAAGPDAVRLHAAPMTGQPPTRGVLEVRLTAGGAPLCVLVNHWPSRGGDRDGAFRRVVAAKVREVVDAALGADADADVLIVGDLNDDPYDASVRTALGAVRSKNAVLNRRDVRHLYNPSWSLLGAPDQGTLYYNRDWVWNVFDQLIVSRGLVADDAGGFAWVDGSLAVHGPDRVRDSYRRPLRFRKGRGGAWQTGYSDHFLVYARLRLPAP